MSRILVVEDEAHLAEGLRFNLEAEGHAVTVTGKGEEALDSVAGKEGERSTPWCSTSCFRERTASPWHASCAKRTTLYPCLMLTARSRSEDVLKGFESGADDYLPKPFNLAILIARLESLLRRKNWMRDHRAISC